MAVVFMLDIQDENGSTVICSVWLNQTQHGYEFNKITSYYGKDNNTGKKAKDEWFAEQVKNGNLLYINKKKASHWASNRLHLLPADPNERSSLDNVPTEEDLVNLKKDKPVLYQMSFKWPDRTKENPEYNHADLFLTPLEKTKLKMSNQRRTFIEYLSKMPSAKEMAYIAMLG